MGIKYIEYSKKFHEGLFPGGKFSYSTVDAAETDREKIEEEALSSLVDTSLPRAEAVTIEPKAKTGRTEAPAVAPGGLAIETPVLTEGEHPEDPSQLYIDPSHLPPVDRPENAHVFFSIYFCLTGLHGIHVLVGMGVMIWLMWLVSRNRIGSEFFTPVDLGGLYWHLVDLIWIYLFPLLYLVE